VEVAFEPPPFLVLRGDQSLAGTLELLDQGDVPKDERRLAGQVGQSLGCLRHRFLRRHLHADRAEQILAIANREGLTGPQARKLAVLDPHRRLHRRGRPARDRMKLPTGSDPDADALCACSLGDQVRHPRQDLGERRLVQAFGEGRHQLVGGLPIPVHDPVGESVCAPTDRLERNRGQGCRGDGREDVRPVASPHDGAGDPDHHRVDRRHHRREGAVDDRPVGHDLDAAQVMTEQRDRRRHGKTEHNREEERDTERVADLVQAERACPDRDDQERGRQDGNDHQPSERLPVVR